MGKQVKKNPRKGPMETAMIPSKLLKAVVAQAAQDGQTFSEYVIELFESAVVGGVNEVRT